MTDNDKAVELARSASSELAKRESTLTVRGLELASTLVLEGAAGQLILVAGEDAFSCSLVLRSERVPEEVKQRYTRVFMASTSASALQLAKRLQPRLLIPSFSVLTPVPDRLSKARADARHRQAMGSRYVGPLDGLNDEEALKRLEDQLHDWVLTFTSILNTCPNCVLLCPDGALDEFPSGVRQRVVAAGRLWEDERSLLSQIKQLIGPPVQRTEEEAARDAAHALYILMDLDDEDARFPAMDELGDYCAYNSAIQQALLAVLTIDQSDSNRKKAAEQLSKAALFPEEVIPVLVTTLGEELEESRSLLKSDHFKTKHWPIFRPLLRERIKTFSRYGSEAKRAVPHLADALAFPDTDIVCEAARTLGVIGKHATDALPTLEQIASDSENPAAQECQNAIERIRS
jgi:hypothetical protein